MDPFEFLEKIAYLLENKPTEFPRVWEKQYKESAGTGICLFGNGSNRLFNQIVTNPVSLAFRQ